MTSSPRSPRPLSRRTLAKGVAWTAPSLVIATAAPAMATSLRKDPGINGWVLTTTRTGRKCKYEIDVDSTVTDYRTPDNAPFGLYLYDVEDDAVVKDAKLTYWIIGNQTANWSTRPGHSSCWGTPRRGTPTRQVDGYIYTPYTWSYRCDIDAADQSTVVDGIRRLWLEHFNVSASFIQPNDVCTDATFWAQRTITIDRDGSGGKYQPEILTFQRRAGTRGTYTGAGARSAGAASGEVAEGESATAVL